MAPLLIFSGGETKVLLPLIRLSSRKEKKKKQRHVLCVLFWNNCKYVKSGIVLHSEKNSFPFLAMGFFLLLEGSNDPKKKQTNIKLVGNDQKAVGNDRNDRNNN